MALGSCISSTKSWILKVIAMWWKKTCCLHSNAKGDVFYFNMTRIQNIELRSKTKTKKFNDSEEEKGKITRLAKNVAIFKSNWVLVICIWFGLVFFASWHISLHGLFNAKAILVEEQPWSYLTHSCDDKWVHIFLKGIGQKMNAVARREFELCRNKK